MLMSADISGISGNFRTWKSLYTWRCMQHHIAIALSYLIHVWGLVKTHSFPPNNSSAKSGRRAKDMLPPTFEKRESCPHPHFPCHWTPGTQYSVAQCKSPVVNSPQPELVPYPRKHSSLCHRHFIEIEDGPILWVWLLVSIPSPIDSDRAWPPFFLPPD